MNRWRWAALAAAAASVAGAGVLATGQADAHETRLRAVLRDPSGVRVGTVTFTVDRNGTQVRAVLDQNRYVAAGAFHGFHVHANNDPANGAGCQADPAKPPGTWFASADGHLAQPGTPHGHPAHAGDMPSPLVLRDGTAALRFETDRVDPALLRGRAIVLHAGPDNFGNVPAGRAPNQYRPNSPAATEATRRSGNAGDRVACGLVQAQ
jgi:superoxide dismutase, Cu-Zn family